MEIFEYPLMAGIVFLMLFLSGVSAQAQSLAVNLPGNQSLSEKSKFFAQQRQALLLKEMRSNPQSYLNHANLAGQRMKFGDDIREYIEEKISKKGKIVAVNNDNFSAGKTATDYYFVSDDIGDSSWYKLYFAANNLANISSGSRVELQGSELGDNIVIADGNALKIASAPAETATGQLSAKIAVILFQFEDNVSTSITKDAMRSIFFTANNSVKALYDEMSYGDASITGDVFGWYTIPVNTSNELVVSENYMKLADIAKEEAVKNGLDASKYDHFVYIHPKLTNAFIGWAGMGMVGGNWIWIDSPTTSDAVMYAHELGHNFGLTHASSLKCGKNPVDYYGSCTTWMYGDLYDIMGSNSGARGHFNAPHKLVAGIMPQSNVTKVTQDGTYTIAPLEAATTKAQALKIYKTDTREYYYLEYRQPIGFDNKTGTSYSNLWQGITRGASIHIWNETKSNPTKLIDATPADTNNEALVDGNSFHDPINDITITQISHNSESVSLKIEGVGSSMQKPIMVATPATVSSNDTISIAWTNVGSPVAGDWIGVFKKGAADSEYVAKIFTSNCTAADDNRIGKTTGDCDFWTGSNPVGNYDIRLFNNRTKTASNTFSITAPSTGDPVLIVSPLTVKPGGTATISWKNIGGATARDWVGIYSRGSANSAYLARFYLSSCLNAPGSSPKASGSCSYVFSAQAKPNTYELRLFSNDTYTKLDIASLKLSNLNLLSLAAKPETVAYGDTLTISWDGIPETTASDQITISPKNSSDGDWMTRFYTSVCVPVQGKPCSNKIKVAMAAGSYEAKLFGGSPLKKIATTAFTITYGTLVSGNITRSTGEALGNVKIDLCDSGIAITDAAGKWSKAVVVGSGFCARVVSGLPALTYAKAANNNTCHASDTTYENQIANEDKFLGCGYSDKRSWDRNTNSGYDFTVFPKAAKCTNQCVSSGLRQCLGNSYQLCADNNNDGCMEWSAAINCAGGQFCESGECRAVAGGNDAKYIFQDVPPTMAAGETYEATIIMKNTGSTPWNYSGNYALISQNGNIWGINKINLLFSDLVSNGESKLFEFTVTAPSVPGTYNFQWAMNNGTQFGQSTPNLSIIVE
ncbi:MAG: NBR1-Ig-like domain-containing protein [Candidatus Paceibacterota bacterium]